MGKALFLQFTSVVLLNVSNRQRDDKEYYELLMRFRLGHSTDDDFQLLRSRILNTDLCRERLDQPPWENATFLVPTNELRIALNELAVMDKCCQLQSEPEIFESTDTR